MTPRPAPHAPATPESRETPMTAPSNPAPFALQTAPSGKVTKWGVPGSEQTFKTKSAAQAWCDAQTEAPEREAELDAEDYFAEYPEDRPTPENPVRALADAAIDLKMEDLLPAGAETDAPASGSYVRVRVGGKSIGYISPRKGGLLVEVLTSRLKGAPEGMLGGTRSRQNQTALLVNDEGTRKQARTMLAYAASTVKGAS